MYEPQEAEVVALRLSALLLVACGGEPAPVEPTQPSPAIQTSWALKGRVTPTRSSHPDALPFTGGRELIQQCGSIRPCAAERWAKTDAPEQTLTLLRRGSEIYQEDGTTWTAQWWTISGVLRACMGDPLSVPPTSDPQAYRTLHTSESGSNWHIHLSGENPCGLQGTLKLATEEDKIDLTELTCGGAPWKKGGRKCAMANRAAALKKKSADNKAGN